MNLQLFYLINNLAFKNPIVDLLGVFFARWAIFLIVGIAAIVISKKGKVSGIFAIVALIFILAIDRILNLTFLLPRPFVVDTGVNLLIEKPSDPSLPSTHAAIAAAAAIFIFSYFGRIASLIFFIFAVLVGISRIFVGVHYPADVLAGWAIGITVSFLFVKLTNWFQSSKNRGEKD